MMHAAEELVEGYVVCGGAEELKTECLKMRAEKLGTKLCLNEQVIEKEDTTNQWKVKVITKEVSDQWKERRREKKMKRKGAVKETPDPRINALQTIEPEGLSIVQGGEWEEIILYVDSGATETVLRRDMLSSVEVTEGPAFRRNVKYEVANGVRIANEGEMKFTGVTEEGSEREITAQVMEVNKALLAVCKIVKAGNKVILGDDEGSYIEDTRTGERIWMKG